jgi:haloalkane dehalogenase
MNSPTFVEHRISRGQGNVYARDYPGTGPAFVLMHGFPDNLRIYDDLVPYLTAAGRRVVTFDFLGFGMSDKVPGTSYGFKQQAGDLEAVADTLDLAKFIPVVHDSSGPAGVNFCVDHPQRVASLCILNSGYDNAAILWPEMITLFATKSLAALAGGVAQSPAQFGWLLGWQQESFGAAQPAEQRARFKTTTGQVIADNFIQQPSSGPAFMQLASGFFEELERNTKRLPQVEALDIPVKVIWGEFDPYMTSEVGKERASHFKRATFKLLPGGHWLQSDLPAEVAKEMLA